MSFFKKRTHNLFADQCRYQDEGEIAGRAGLTREDCPYSEDETTAWNFWVYGCENAGAERAAILSGQINIAVGVTGADYVYKPHYVSVPDAFRHGWRPMHHTSTEVFAMYENSKAESEK